MTHTSTEQVDPWVIIEKLRAQHRAEIHETWIPLVDNLRSQLEAAQAQRAPLTDEQIEAAFKAAGGRWADDSYWLIEDADLHPFVRSITQEKQG